MDILLDNPLTNMYGPYFLLLYGAVTLFTILFILFIKTRVDQSDRLPLPAIPAKIDPYEIAYLRGGLNEMARTAVFSLMQKGLVEIKSDEKPPIITRTSLSDWRGMATVEDAALNWFVVSRQPKEVFARDGLVEKIAPYADEYERRLSRQQLIAGPEIYDRFSKWKWAACFFLAGLGGYKALVSIMYGHYNLIGILVIAIIGLVVIAISGQAPRLTRLGKAYLERLQTAFDGLRAHKPENPQLTPAAADGPGGFDPLLLSVGIFGGVVLTGTSYWGYNEIFEKHQKDQAALSGGCGAGCGSGCSSGGSSCSSGNSCGSSGCGGGGGGCGGGGCGGS